MAHSTEDRFTSLWLVSVLRLMLILVLTLHVSYPLLVQAQSELPEGTTLAAIEAFAERHARTGGPMQTALVLELFRDNPDGLTEGEIALIYEEKFDKTWSGGLDVLMLIAVLSLIANGVLALVAFRDALSSSWIGKNVKSLSTCLRLRLAGDRRFRRRAMRRYKRGLWRRYHQLYIPFRPGRPLEVLSVYVPVRAHGHPDVRETGVEAALEEYQRLILTGPPGSGKSMLLKALVLQYAEQGGLRLSHSPVPILLELSRLNSSDLSLEEHLFEELSRSGMRQAAELLSSWVRNGEALLLLDGLDEVRSARRHDVAQQIMDFLQLNHKCRVVITCRTAVYKGELDEIADVRLEMLEFNDQQVYRFLRTWEQDIPLGKSVAQLVQSLRDRPRLMAVARNPLLLTIIAYLYADTTFILPNSRSEFYQQAIDVLLRQWHERHNEFPAGAKSLLLQHLALFALDTADERAQDRRSLEYKSVQVEARKILPSLNLRSDQGPAQLLDEIVERSGLLLSIDGGARYQFAHTNLVEYLAAAKLVGDWGALLRRFSKDRDLWRETVKLWCGIAGDSTRAIQAVFREAPVVAFECLADAQQVDHVLADRVVDYFKGKLGGSENAELIEQAFGAVAADLRPRGRAIFDFLKKTLNTDWDRARRIAAARALSLTNLPAAAEVLANRYSDGFEDRDPLVRMGDLAVPTLGALARRGQILGAVDDLHEIGTARAAQELLLLLWHKDKNLATRAAWFLASLLRNPEIEDAMREQELTDQQKTAGHLSWIWNPFPEQKASSLPIIAGRIGFLLDEASNGTMPEKTVKLDRRIAIPLCLRAISQEANLQQIDFQRIQIGDLVVERREDWEASMDKLFMAIAKLKDRGELREEEEQSWAEKMRRSIEDSWKRRLLTKKLMDYEHEDLSILPLAPYHEVSSEIEELVDAARPSARCKYVLAGLGINTRVALLRRFLEGPIPTEGDWANVLRPLKYRFDRGWHYLVVIAVALALSGLACSQMLRTLLTLAKAPNWSEVIPVAAMVSVLAGWSLFTFATSNMAGPRKPMSFVFSILLGCISWPLALFILGLGGGKWRERIILLAHVVVFMPFVPAVVYYSSLEFLLHFRIWPILAVLWLLLAVICTFLWKVGRNRERQALNPLYGILDLRDG